jgi:hypothetical protein
VQLRGEAKLYRDKAGVFMISRSRGLPTRKAGASLAVGITGAVFIVGAVAVFGAAPANAKPEFSAQTKLPCGQCHANPAGGGKLKAFGEKFKAKGNKL